jgi:hypothetical protein
MTTQPTQMTVGNSSFSKVFADTSTDSVWSGNVLLDTISDQSMGILIPNSTLSWVQPEYNAGGMAWRIQNAQSLQVSRWGFGCFGGQSTKQYMTPYMVNPNDILTTFPVAAQQGAGNVACLAWVTTTKGTELFTATPASGAAGLMVTAVNAQSLGDAFFNSQILSIMVQTEDGTRLNSVEVIDNLGGVQMTVQGNARGAMGIGGSNAYNNLSCDGLSIPVGKGFTLRVKGTIV